MLSNIGNFLNSLDSVVKDTLAEEDTKLPLPKRKSPRTNNDEDEYSVNTNSKEINEVYLYSRVNILLVRIY